MADRLGQVLQQRITDCASETHMDERIVPTNNAPRVLFTGIDAGMATKSQERNNKHRRNTGGERRATGAVD